MEIQIQITTRYGTYLGEILKVTSEQYGAIIEMSKSFYETGFEMSTEDGGFVIIPPDIVKDSILKINLINNV